MEQDLVSAGYDAVYAAAAKSPTLRRLWHEHAEGPASRGDFGHISFTPRRELQRVAAELRLRPADTLVDLGCGMAGPALWVGGGTGGRLIGVSVFRGGVGHARARAG